MYSLVEKSPPESTNSKFEVLISRPVDRGKKTWRHEIECHFQCCSTYSSQGPTVYKILTYVNVLFHLVASTSPEQC